MKYNSVCPKCGEEYVMGWSGMVDGCDRCLGVVRDGDGCAWLPNEEYHDYLSLVTGKVFRVTRQEALGLKQ